MLLSVGNRAECALLVSGDNYPIDFNISKNRISLIRLFICAKNVIEEKKSCNKKICLKNHSVIHLELLATYAIIPLVFCLGGMILKWLIFILRNRIASPT